MDPDRFIQRCWFLIASPEKEWHLIKKENKPYASVLLLFVLPVILIGSFSLWAGSFFTTSILIEAIIRVFREILFLGVYVAGIYTITNWFSGKPEFDRVFQLAAYSMAIVWITEIFANLTFLLSWVQFFGLYALYVLYYGIKPILKIPSNLRNPAFVVLAFWLLISWFAVELLFHWI